MKRVAFDNHKVLCVRNFGWNEKKFQYTRSSGWYTSLARWKPIEPATEQFVLNSELMFERAKLPVPLVQLQHFQLACAVINWTPTPKTTWASRVLIACHDMKVRNAALRTHHMDVHQQPHEVFVFKHILSLACVRVEHLLGVVFGMHNKNYTLVPVSMVEWYKTCLHLFPVLSVITTTIAELTSGSGG